LQVRFLARFISAVMPIEGAIVILDSEHTVEAAEYQFLRPLSTPQSATPLARPIPAARRALDAITGNSNLGGELPGDFD